MQNYVIERGGVKFTQFELSKLLISGKFFVRVSLSPSARLVLVVLCSHFPNMYPSIQTIMEESGIASKTSVINSLKELSKAGFLLYETKNVNHYTFTSKFFEEIGIEPTGYKNWKVGGTKIGNKQINEKRNNKRGKNLKKVDEGVQERGGKWNLRERAGKQRSFYSDYCQNPGVNYKKFVPEKVKKESPLDFNREQALEFLENLPGRMQNSYFAMELRKKWGFEKAKRQTAGHEHGELVLAG